MKTSLKKALQSQPTEQEKNKEQPLEGEALNVSKECINTATESPEETK
ncbi:hypothetical protein OROMI_026205 [Orobanche minor]